MDKSAHRIPKKWLELSIWLTSLGFLAAAYAPLMDSQILGFFHDDGVYAITAKALASGQGLHLLHLPGLPTEIKYPVFYPLLLTLAWIIQPSFPANMPLMHWLTTLFGIAGIGILYLYLRQIQRCNAVLSGIISLLVACNFFFLFYTTVLMSEAPYFCLSLLTLFIAEKYVATERSSIKWLCLTVLLSALAFHTRTIGLVLIGAIGLFLALQKQWKTFSIYLLCTLSISLLPWGIWVKTHTPALNAFNYPLVYMYGGYGPEYAINAPHSPWVYFQALLDKGIQPIVDSSLALLFPQLSYQFAGNPILVKSLALLLSTVLLAYGLYFLRRKQFNVSGIYVSLYLMVIAGWMYPYQAERFLIMVLPFLWLYIFRCLNKLSDRLKAFPLQIQQVLLIVLLIWTTGWPAIQGYQLLHRIRANHWLEPSGRYARLWQDYQAAFEFIRQHTNANAPVAGIWDPAIYLYTGHSAFGVFTSALQPVNGKALPESFNRLFNSLKHYQVRYVMNEPFLFNQEIKAPVNPVVEALKNQYPQAFKPIYQSPHQWITIYELAR